MFCVVQIMTLFRLVERSNAITSAIKKYFMTLVYAIDEAGRRMVKDEEGSWS